MVQIDGLNEAAQKINALKLDTNDTASNTSTLPAPAPTDLNQSLFPGMPEAADLPATPSKANGPPSSSDPATLSQLEVDEVSHPPATLSASTTIPLRLNLPLLTELRDEIYGYLLHNKSVESGRTYHFHTNLMAVNQSIHDEAEKYLYKNNIFVVFSYRWTMKIPLNLDFVSGITEKNVHRMKHHSLRIHSTFVEPGPRPPVRSMLMLAHNVESMCRAMQLPLFARIGTVPHLSSLPGKALQLRHANFFRVQMLSSALVELRSTKHRKIDSALQHSLLGPLRGLVSDAQRVTMSGAIADTANIETTRSLMSPSLIWTEAKKWAVHSAVTGFKADIDALVTHNRYELAAESYVWLLPFVNSVLLSTFFPTVNKDFVSNADLAIDALSVDLCVSGAWLALGNGNLGQVSKCLDQLALARTNHVSLQMLRSKPAYRHLLLLARIYFPDGGNPDGLDSFHFDELLCALQSEFPHDRHLLRDRNTLQLAINFLFVNKINADPTAWAARSVEVIAQEIASAHHMPSKELIPLDVCSARLLKPRIFDSSSEVPKKPDNIVGWQDLAHLASFSAEEKKQIREAQNG